ncbi:MAG: CO dehydrogenase/acetyl-CoA synthase complex subunit epsilon [Candidatus Hecatellaceae archaeon]
MSTILPSRTSPYETGNIPGPQMALSPAKASTVYASLTKRAKNPLLIVGKYVLEVELDGKSLADYAIEISKKKDIPIVATAHTLKIFIEKKYPAVSMGIVEIVNRLQDSSFTVDPKRPSPHDLVLFLGITYQLASQGLSTLKHFAPHLKTVTLCKWYHPNADWSFPNMKDDEWKKALEEFINGLG